MTVTRNAALAFILVTVLLDVLALGIVIPVLPKLVAQFLAEDTSRAASWFGLMSATWALMQFVFSPVLGALSDRFGRRPVILVSNLGLGLDYVLMALAPSLGWLFLGRVISGICAASFSTATAYIADVTPVERRAAAFGMIGAAFGLGFIAGPAVGGLLGGMDPRLPFWVAAGFSLANACYGYFVLPESLPLASRSAFAWAKANPLGAMRLLASDTVLVRLSAVNFLHYLAHAILPALTVLYCSYRYGWGIRGVGLLLAAVGVSSAIVQGLLIRPIIARLGPGRSLILGYALGAVSLAIYGTASSPILFCLGIPVGALWGIAAPSCQQLMTERVGPQAQGKLQGANSSLMAIANLIGPILFTQIFAATLVWGTPYSGFAYILAAAFLSLAALGAGWTLRRTARQSQ